MQAMCLLDNPVVTFWSLKFNAYNQIVNSYECSDSVGEAAMRSLKTQTVSCDSEIDIEESQTSQIKHRKPCKAILNSSDKGNATGMMKFEDTEEFAS